jgi:hypothetical protein
LLSRVLNPISFVVFSSLQWRMAGQATLLPDAETRRAAGGAPRRCTHRLAGAYRIRRRPMRFFFGQSLEQWFQDALLLKHGQSRPAYVYRQGGYLLFADLQAVAREIPDQSELLRLTKALLRERTTLVKLHVQRGDDVEQLVAYWGRGSREDYVRPLLESLARLHRGQQVDIVHLLPAFARRHLYTYPRLTSPAGGNRPDCFWTALNFFSDAADDRLLEPDIVKRTFSRDWRYVSGPPQFGDLVMFHDEREVAHHAAVYLADDILFSKNGSVLSRPWFSPAASSCSSSTGATPRSPCGIFGGLT